MGVGTHPNCIFGVFTRDSCEVFDFVNVLFVDFGSHRQATADVGRIRSLDDGCALDRSNQSVNRRTSRVRGSPHQEISADASKAENNLSRIRSI